MKDCNNRHVCFKDLEAYVRKDSYFAGLSKTEQEEIIKNLGIITREDVYDIVRSYIESAIPVTYKQINELIQHRELAPGHIYIITDFQTIYKSNTGATWGTGNHESKIFSIIVQALTDNTLNSDVKILSEDFPNSLLWEVRYDPTQEIINSVRTKGRITYLKDEHGNSAYYDFKNIQYRISKEDLLKVGIETAKEYKDYYTFNDTAENVEISKGSTQNVFIKSAHNVKIGLDCENNLFNSQIRNTTILDGVSDSFVKHSIFQEDIFKVIQNSSINKVVSYIDGDTLTMQTYAIDNIY